VGKILGERMKIRYTYPIRARPFRCKANLGEINWVRQEWVFASEGERTRLLHAGKGIGCLISLRVSCSYPLHKDKDKNKKQGE